jgi:hypothetical protein
MNDDLIAPCGMNCGLCINYLAQTNDLKKQGFHKSYCPGCIPRGKHCTYMHGNCELLGTGQVRFCYQCGDFPCRRLKDFDKRYRGRYHMSMIENLNFIQERGMPEFLAQEEAKWRCSRCGGTICCHNGLCLKCDLDKLKENKKYRWGEE